MPGPCNIGIFFMNSLGGIFFILSRAHPQRSPATETQKMPYKFGCMDIKCLYAHAVESLQKN
jgi:hypothetical protein